MQDGPVPQNNDEYINEPINEEDLAVVHNDNIVSEDEDYVEQEEDDEESETGISPEVTAVVAELDDQLEEEETEHISRPSRKMQDRV